MALIDAIGQLRNIAIALIMGSMSEIAWFRQNIARGPCGDDEDGGETFSQ
jgi:hypothetical protein